MLKPKAPREFLDPQKISKHLFCAICHEVFDDPNRMMCGHTFCYVCIEGWASMTKLCPQCKSSLKKRKPEKDLIAAHMIDDLMAKCSHLNCTWTGVYSMVKKHQRICEYKQKKEVDSIEEEKVVNVPDDQEIKNAVENKKVGKKKIKKNEEQNAPVFLESQQQQSLDLQPLIQNRRRPQNEDSQNNKTNSQLINISHIQSSSSDGYLETNLAKIIKSKRTSSQYEQIEAEKLHKNERDHSFQEEKQNNISRSLRDISFDDGNDIELYPRGDNRDEQNGFNKKYTNFTENNLDQPEFFMYLNKKNRGPDNSYLYERYQEDEKKKRQKQERTKLNWTIKQASSTSSQRKNDSDSDLENPFDQPLPSSQRYPVINDVIILDSSEECNLNTEKQSGEISVRLFNNQQNEDKVLQSGQNSDQENDKMQMSGCQHQMIDDESKKDLNEWVRRIEEIYGEKY